MSTTTAAVAAFLAVLCFGSTNTFAGNSTVSAPPSDLGDAITGGSPLIEVRARYENVDQANLVNRGQSFSLRTRLGWETADFHGLKALLEVANSFHLDGGAYNVGVPGGTSLNGKTQYPIINDPQFTDLNRAQLSWAVMPDLTLTAGRQRVLIDDQRFIGNSGWRQDEQRFDAARVDFSLWQLKATYMYVWRVDRIFGGHLDWISDSHVFNVSYDFADPLKLEGFVYALDFHNSPVNSTLTGGVRGSGKWKFDPIALSYSATWAHQSEYQNNPARFALDYWQVDLAGTWNIATIDFDYEQLGGNGARGFITPLATTHGFQGWADAFAAVAGNKTHVDGIEDFNITLSVKPNWSYGPFSKPEALIRHHNFWTEFTGAGLGEEWDAQIKTTVDDKFTAAVKFASFDQVRSVPIGTAAAPASRTKFWLTVEYKL